MKTSTPTRSAAFLAALLTTLCMLLGPVAASAQQLKIATLAPDGSSWMESLRAAADAVEQRTDGTVTTRFYPGGVMGDAATLLRRIRLGQLHGGTFTVGELATIAPESNLYSLPFQFENASELAALREEFDPFILAALERNGMIAPAISNGGFAYLFSRDRIAGADQVDTGFKVWIPENDPLSRRTLERLGASAIGLGLAEVYTGLQTGTINTFGSTLSGAIILQWHTRARFVLDLPVLVTAGTLAIDGKAFERMSPEHQAIWREEFARALRQQEAASTAENEAARVALAGEGIEFVTPAAEDVSEWHGVANEVLDEMLDSGEFELPGIERLRERLEEIRGTREPLNKSARSADCRTSRSEKPQIVWCDASDSSRRYGQVTSRARCGFSGETLSGRAFAGHPPRFDSPIWNHQTALAEATPAEPAKTPSRPRRVPSP